MDREIYNRLMARKIGYEHLIGHSEQDARDLLTIKKKSVTVAYWNREEKYLEDGIFVEDQINLVIKDGKVWSVSPSYDNAVL